MAWLKAEAISAEPNVESETLLFAASLNFCQVLNGPVFVARSGKTTDLRCSSWKKARLLCSGLVACGVVCDCALADGASGGEPAWVCCATQTEPSKQIVVDKTRRRSPASEGPFFRADLTICPKGMLDDSIGQAGWQLQRLCESCTSIFRAAMMLMVLAILIRAMAGSI